MSVEDGTFVLPEGRAINAHLFTRHAFSDPARGITDDKPKYSVEMVFPKPESGSEDILMPFEDFLWDVMVASRGEEEVKQYNAEKWIAWPIKDGDKKTARRAAAGKNGDAYAGMSIVSASNMYNRFGQPADGGIPVYDENAEAIHVEAGANAMSLAAAAAKVWPGMMGIAAVKAKVYMGTGDSGDPKLTCALYLEAFQKTGDGERLVAEADHSNLFQAVRQGGGARRERPSR